jgi:pSer/pThr/pTyr-binding forkhead associated (FHA) protein
VELVVTEGPDAGKKVTVEAEVVLGRAAGCDLVLDDPEVSRRHAVLRVHGPGAEIEDLDSTNGTFVNDQEIEGPTSIGPGDLIRVGRTRLAMETDLRSAETQAVPAGPAPAAATAPIRIDSGNVPRWSPQKETRSPRLPTAELPPSEARPGVRLPGDVRGWALVGAIALVIVAILLFALLSGGAVSKEDFIASADKTCRSTQLKARNWIPGSAGTRARLRRASTHLVRIRRSGLAELRSLDQPASSAKKLTRFYAAVRRVDRSLGRLAAAAGVERKAVRKRRIDRARKRLHRAVVGERRAADAFGFKSCGKLIGI